MTAYATYPSLRDRAVLITGGASGIGASLVQHFAAQGSRVAFLDRDTAAATELLQNLSPDTPHPPVFLPCDLTDLDSLALAIARADSSLGSIEVLVNNAGNDRRHRFPEVTRAFWDQTIATNLRHQFFAAQAVVPGMRARGRGSILNLSSISWIIPTPDVVVYNTAKAGLIGFTRSLAHQLGPDDIRVNAILPGAIATDRQRRDVWTPENEQRVLSSQSLKRPIPPDDVSRLCLFLAADDSASITGQGYILDAGWV